MDDNTYGPREPAMRYHWRLSPDLDRALYVSEEMRRALARLREDPACFEAIAREAGLNPDRVACVMPVHDEITFEVRHATSEELERFLAALRDHAGAVLPVRIMEG